ncbi:hypothetical protein J2B92_10020 [Lysinibacillus sphaericus]|nr:insecticidal delta-endotoxin Cry8Ea1 family protein [Lysinibacillus sphaericus]MBG9755941.1 hypothetical protein [Lysinibacillus sphaericus]QTB15487.1 hypothetical protein J2B92_10020 [Lysinibacillus sphaericus]
MDINNNNEKEIINSHLLPASLLKKHPIKSLQSTNYKDWLNLCQDFNKDIESYDLVTAVSSGTIVVGTMLSAIYAPAIIAGPIGVIGAIIISFGTLLPLLWSEDENNPKTVWIEFIRMGERLVDKTISQTVLNILESYLKDLKVNLIDYEKAKQDWIELKKQQLPGSPPSINLRNAADIAHQRLDSLHNKFAELNVFKVASYETILLPVYAQAANLHLNLLQQGAMFADQWIEDKYSPRNDTFAGNSNDYQDLLKSRTITYINHIENTYKDGLNYLWNQPEMTWDIYNEYRTNMTLTALDLLPLFPFYNKELYDPRVGIKSELTREVYINTPVDPHLHRYFKLGETEDKLTNNSELFKWLTSLKFRTFNQPGFPFLIGNMNYFKKTNGTQLINNQQQLWSFPGTTEIEKLFPSPANIDKVTMYIYYGSGWEVPEPISITINKLIFNHHKHGLITEYDAGNTNAPTMGIYVNLPKHYLSCLNSYYPLTATTNGMGKEELKMYSFGWTHESVDFLNEISNDKITQIPAVKAYNLNSNSRVIKGPGHIGGNLVYLSDKSQLSLACRYTNSSPQDFLIRIRYASNKRNMVQLFTPFSTHQFVLPQTFNHLNIEQTKYEDYEYAQLPGSLTINGNVNIDLLFLLNVLDGGELLLDKIEFIPLTQKVKDNLEKEKIDMLKNLTDSLFNSPAKDTLKIDSTDYQIDQIAFQIESINEEINTQEKMKLLDNIKYAKKLNQLRNLLYSRESQAQIDWVTSNDVSIYHGKKPFNEYTLVMSGSSLSKITSSNYPTYIYKKIEESKLKPYTRYLVRGFISNSDNLEIFISRYENEIHTNMNVHVDDDTLLNSYKRQNECESKLPIVFDETSQFPLSPSRTSGISNHSYYNGAQQSSCHDTQIFSFSIDTGDVDFNEYPGIEILFKLSNSNGYASISNLEVIEERLLTEEEKRHIIEIENRWKAKKEIQRNETEKETTQAQQAINNLFTDTQYSKLKFETTKQSISKANAILENIPYVYNSLLPTEPGMNFELFNSFKDQINKAHTLYKMRNSIKNGDFINGTKYWSISTDVKLEKTNIETILVMSSWSAQSSQQILVQKQNRYLLRVIAKKEDMGSGNVTISDCLNNIAKIEFIPHDCNMNYIQNSSEFIIKTIQFSPNTDQVRIDIGESDGIFKIKSIELICINN